jgi:hypothetical protein
MNRITRETAAEAVRDAVRHRLDDLINPSDVVDGADTWAEVPHERVVDECSQSADIILNERQNPSIMQTIDDLTASFVMDSLRRVPREALDIPNDRETIRSYRLWPYNMDKWECWEVVTSTDVPFSRAYPSDWSEARMVAHGAITDEMASFHPDS